MRVQNRSDVGTSQATSVLTSVDKKTLTNLPSQANSTESSQYSYGSSYSFRSIKSNLSHQDSLLRHDKLMKRWTKNTGEKSLFNLDLSTSTLMGDSSLDLSEREPPFTFPFDVYDYIDSNKIDELIAIFREYLSESEHSEEDWNTVLKWNNQEFLRLLCTYSEYVSDSKFDLLIESLLLLVDINRERFTAALVTSTFISRLLQSLTTNNILSLLKRLQLFSILFQYGGLAFPDLPLHHCAALIHLVSHENERVRQFSATVCMLGYLRLESDSLWHALQEQMSLDCKKFFMYHTTQILSGKDKDASDMHIKASLLWMETCFRKNVYFTLHNFQPVLDLILTNVRSENNIEKELLLIAHVGCIKEMMNWPIFFEANYRVDDTLSALNYLLAEGGKRGYTDMCTAISGILNEHLDKLDKIGQESKEDELVVFE